MKKMLCLLTALVICLTMAVPALADEFVPSITYKDAPELVSAIMGGKDVSGALIITSIIGAENKTTGITQGERDHLLDVYDALESGEMDLPIEGNFVIRDLVDITFREHDGETSVFLTFDLGVAATDEVICMQYKNNKWNDVKLTNNGDGTVTCEFTHFCPVAFAVKQSDNPKGGDSVGQEMILWIGVMVAAAAGVTVVIANRRKFFN